MTRAVLGVPKHVTVGFWRGLVYPFRGMRFVYLEHPGLVRYWGAPIAITLAALVGAMYGAWAVHGDVTSWMWAIPTGAGFWASLARGLHTALEWIVLLLLGALGLVVVVALSNVFAAPFNDALSEEVERLVVGRPGPPFRLAALLRDLLRSIGLELAKLGLYLLVMGPLFALSLLVPSVGQIVYSVFAFLFTAMYFAIDYIDWPAGRRDRGIGYRFALMRRRFLPMLGFGTGVWVLLFVPLVNLLFMPAAVAGGTLLFLDMEASPVG